MMRYDSEDFTRLSLEVEVQGGACLQEACVGTEFRLKVPNSQDKHEWRRYRTSHCDMAARMDVPYEGEQGIAGVVRVCAVDDAVGLWPRFAGVVSDKSKLT